MLSKDQGYLTEEAKASLKKLKGVLPKGKLGKYEISRLVIGCNPMGGWSHSRDLNYVGQLSKHWQQGRYGLQMEFAGPMRMVPILYVSACTISRWLMMLTPLLKY